MCEGVPFSVTALLNTEKLATKRPGERRQDQLPTFDLPRHAAFLVGQEATWEWTAQVTSQYVSMFFISQLTCCVFLVVPQKAENGELGAKGTTVASGPPQSYGKSDRVSKRVQGDRYMVYG